LLRPLWHRWSLSRVFGKKRLSDFIDLPRSELAAALIASEGVTSSANAFIKEQLAAIEDDASDGARRSNAAQFSAAPILPQRTAQSLNWS
jgi:hypothetical protein